MGKKRIITKGETSAGETPDQKPQIDSAEKEVVSSRRTKNGAAYILATYNNTLITITDNSGNVVGWSSAGTMGFKGTKKATPYAAARAAEAVAEKAKNAGIESIAVFVKGIGSGRESAIRALSNYGMDVTFIKDVTPIPHNGPRPKKVRRV